MTSCRRLIARAGVLITIFLSLAYPASTFLELECRASSGTLAISHGFAAFSLLSLAPRSRLAPPPRHCSIQTVFPDLTNQLPRYTFLRGRSFNYLFSICIPLWLPLALAALPTLTLLHVERRRTPPHLCASCRYPRAGLTTSLCPECGNASAP